ncbi:MAG TPA: hypothetical protein VER17_04265 [Tepidisphaeraceae bacterium]|nr:hypothetical protein [Tepidisphaeraceae bacterium]
MSDETQPASVPADPLVDEVRSLRRERSDRFGNDVTRLGRHLQAQEHPGTRDVRQPPPAPDRAERAG